MPGNVAYSATPTVVMPFSVSQSFVRRRAYQGLINTEYCDASADRSALVTNSRKSWTLAKNLTPAAMQTLRDFWIDRKGGTLPFYFYDGMETVPKWSWDPTGASSTGRYIVRFEGGWSDEILLNRANATITLVEIQ